MKLYALESKSGSVGFKTVVVIADEDLETVKKTYNVEEVKTSTPVKKAKVKKEK